MPNFHSFNTNVICGHYNFVGCILKKEKWKLFIRFIMYVCSYTCSHGSNYWIKLIQTNHIRHILNFV